MMETEAYTSQRARWPQTGRHILADFDDDSVVVYQAYKPSIGRWAVEHQTFGGDFSFGRMSWVKPNFLWMMYRCGWATKSDQETVLAVRISRKGFDEMLRRAVHSSYVEAVYGTRDAWQSAVRSSDVRLQWDPDHDPGGAKEERRAIQLGLRDEALRQYASDWLVSITDVTEFVARQRENVGTETLVLPRERVYPVTDESVRTRLGM